MTDMIKHRELESDADFKPSPNSCLSPPSVIIPRVLQDEVDNCDYRFEAARLQSFEDWPVPFIERETLAADGFYYTGVCDVVRCFECLLELSQWVEGDNPMVDHQRWSPECRFIRKMPCGNVPIGEDRS